MVLLMKAWVARISGGDIMLTPKKIALLTTDSPQVTLSDYFGFMSTSWHYSMGSGLLTMCLGDAVSTSFKWDLDALYYKPEPLS